MNGTLESVGERWRLRFTRVLRHDPDTVWRAITEPEHLKAWFPDTISGEWTVGAKLTFSAAAAAIPDFKGEVRAVEPPRLLEFSWGPDVLRFEIEPAPHGCTLTLLDTFDGQGKAARDAAGWHVCLDRLYAALDGEEAATGEEWQRLQRGYADTFGPAAATIGPPEGSGTG
jgi:uncharacterized protein YndB with AHSA1/START domain